MAKTKGKLLHTSSVNVRWGDMDLYGHVNNALYLRYLEEARIELLTKPGAKLDGCGIDPVIIKCRLHIYATRQLPRHAPDKLLCRRSRALQLYNQL